MPHATVLAAAQLPQHTRAVGAVMPGGFTQLRPLGHCAPTPLQVRHVPPDGSCWLGIVVPHVTALAAGQFGQQPPAMQSLPAGQSVPVPLQTVPPMHASGMSTLQSTMFAGAHVSVHTQVPPMHTRPPSHGPMQ